MADIISLKANLEIEIPVPPSAQRANEVSKEFRDYYQSLAKARINLEAYLAKTKDHHFFVSGAEPLEEVPTAEDEQPDTPVVVAQK
jgi:hypothetical protein